MSWLSVPDWVSSLKRDPTPSLVPSKIGFENATLCWNSGKENAAPASDAKTVTPPDSSPDIEETETVVESEETRAFQLSKINVTFPLHKLTVITGPTGAGKTAFLTALLGEMNLLEGRTFLPKNVHSVDQVTKLRDSIAYAAQTPWLQQKSIKDNILFGEVFDEERYEATLEACALWDHLYYAITGNLLLSVQDLDILEDGDMTEIGQKGVSLS